MNIGKFISKAIIFYKSIEKSTARERTAATLVINAAEKLGVNKKTIEALATMYLLHNGLAS